MFFIFTIGVHWGSQGDFSFNHAIGDVRAALQYVAQPENLKRFHSDVEHIILVGHSMGGFMAAINATEAIHIEAAGERKGDMGGSTMNLPLAGIILMSPWDLGRAGDLLADKPENQKFIDASREEFRGYELALHGFTADDGISDLRSHTDDWQLTKIAGKIVAKKVPVLMVTGKYEDTREEGFDLLRDAFRAAAKSAPPTAFTSVELPTDHAYSDQRIALQSVIVKWLGRVK